MHSHLKEFLLVIGTLVSLKDVRYVIHCLALRMVV